MGRHHEVRALAVQPLERLLEGREPEEPVLLALADQRGLVDRAAVALEDLVLDLEVGTAGAVPAFVHALVDVPVVVDPLERLLDPGLVLGVGGANEEIVRDPEAWHQRLEPLGVAVGELLGLEPLRVRRVGDRLAVLVGAGEKEDVLAALAHVAREHVGGDRRVRVAEVRLRVDVIDRSGDVEGLRCLYRVLLVVGSVAPRVVSGGWLAKTQGATRIKKVCERPRTKPGAAPVDSNATEPATGSTKAIFP